MTDDDICGGETASGGECQLPSTRSDGRCHHHTEVEKQSRGGRPSKLSKDVVDTVTRHIAEGKSDAEAFRKANLHPSTKLNWLQRIDDPDEVPMEPDFDEDPYGYFFRRYTHARGLGEEWYTDKIMELAVEQADLEALMAMLKQRYPKSWGDVDRGEQAGGIIVRASDPDDYEVDPESLEVESGPDT